MMVVEASTTSVMTGVVTPTPTDGTPMNPLDPTNGEKLPWWFLTMGGVPQNLHWSTGWGNTLFGAGGMRFFTTKLLPARAECPTWKPPPLPCAEAVDGAR